MADLTGYMSAEQLRQALADAGVPVSASIEPRGGAMKLAEYWTHGDGAAKIRWGSSGDFDRCVAHLTGKVSDPKGLCNEYHQMAVGAPPGKGHAAAAPPTVLRGVELARPGTFDLSTGRCEFTEAMLRDAADFYTATGSGAIPIGLGHADQRFDGEPAFGWVERVRYAEDDRGPVLLGDLVDLPGWLAAEAPKRWRNRSIEAFANVDFQGRTYGLALTRLALLGATPPGIPSISSLSDLQTALAASTRLAGPVGDPDVPAVPDVPPDPGDQPGLPTQEGAGMDPAKLREALGLPPDASDDDVGAALAAAGVKVAASSPPPPDPTPQPQPQPGQPAPGQPTPQPQPGSPQSSLPPGVIVIDASQLAEFQDSMRRADLVAKQVQKRHRDDVIAAAIGEGKFPPFRKAHWEQAWDVDPAGTEQAIEQLQAGLIPVAASGYAGAADGDVEFEQFRHLFPPEPKGAGRG